MHNLFDRRITERDRQEAHKRACYTLQNFRDVLRRDLSRCLAGRECVSIEEFVDYFNSVNVGRGCKPLDTRNVKYAAYFGALHDVCAVDALYADLYPPSRMSEDGPVNNRIRERKSSKSQPPPSKPSSQREHVSEPPPMMHRGRSLSLSPTSEAAQRSQRTSPEEVRRDFTIAEVQKILVDFTHGLSGETLSWQEFCDKLKAYNPAAFSRFFVLRPTNAREFLESDVSGIKNKIRVELSRASTTLSISDCSCCRSFPQSSVVNGMPSETDDDAAFSSAMGRFKQVQLPLEDWLEVHVADVDSVPRKLCLRFVWKSQQFEELHEQLRADYQNNQQRVNDVKVGMDCAVPLDGTKDYHRGIVKDITDPSLPVVFYADLGIKREVAVGCIRKLHSKFHNVPTFYLAGEVRDSPPYQERIHLANKLRMKERVILRAENYDRIKGRYILLLDTDSGIMSDASRD